MSQPDPRDAGCDRGVVVGACNLSGPERIEEVIRSHRRLLDSIGEAVIATNLGGEVVYWNQAAQTLYGWSSEEVMGRALTNFLLPDGTTEQAARIMAGVRTGRTWSGEFDLKRKDGTRLCVLVTDAPILNDGGVPVGMIGVSTDVTDRKRVQDALRESEARLAEAQSLAEVGDWDWNVPSDIALWSKEMYRIFGVAEGTPVSFESFLERIHPADRAFAQDIVRSALERRLPFSYEARAVRPNGEVRWLRIRGTVVVDEEGEPYRMHGVAQDITDLRLAQDALKRSEERFRSLVQNSSDIITVVDTGGLILYQSPSMKRILGYDPEDRIGNRVFEHAHPEDESPLRKQLARALSGAEDIDCSECRFQRKDGEWRWLQIVGTNLLSDPAVGGYVINARDVTERKVLEGRLQHQALHDDLTDLPNRTLFEEYLGRALRRTRRREDKVAVLFMDLDDFKIINDSLGHEAGDLVLIGVAGRLAGCLRSEDLLARFGGDEFTVMLEGVKGSEDALEIAGRLVEVLREPFVLNGKRLFVSASVGVALCSSGTEDSVSLLRNADAAMYRAKKQVSGKCYLFDPIMYRQAMERLELENDLRRAIEREEFVVHYQPIVRLQTEEVWGVEALVRWEHPEEGFLSPAKFIPAAEESGLIVPIGKLVLEEACRQAARWQERHSRIPPLVMSVNLSVKQLGRNDLAKVVGEILQESGLEPHLLSLDVTETVYIKTLEENKSAMDGLKKLGVGMSIDDFGVGYSSLSYLKRVPATILKIDRSFVAGVGVEVENTAIVQMVIDLAHALGMEVVAEGVESEAQTLQLLEMGCDFAQGYYFSKALPSEKIGRFVFG